MQRRSHKRWDAVDTTPTRIEPPSRAVGRMTASDFCKDRAEPFEKAGEQEPATVLGTIRNFFGAQ